SYADPGSAGGRGRPGRLHGRPARARAGARRAQARSPHPAPDRAAHRQRVHPRPGALVQQRQLAAGGRRAGRRAAPAGARVPCARRLRPGGRPRGPSPDAGVHRAALPLREPAALVAGARLRVAGRGVRPHRHGGRWRPGPSGAEAGRGRDLRPGRAELGGVRNAASGLRLWRRPRAASAGEHRTRHPRVVQGQETNVIPESKVARRGLPLQIKVSALVVLALVSLAAASGLSNYFYFRSVLKQEAIARGKAISATLASALVEMPDSAVGATIASVKKEAGLAYVEVVSPNGVIVAHTFEGRAPHQDASVLRESEKGQD